MGGGSGDGGGGGVLLLFFVVVDGGGGGGGGCPPWKQTTKVMALPPSIWLMVNLYVHFHPQGLARLKWVNSSKCKNRSV